MKTSVISVHDMLSVLSVVGVEKRIGEVPGVESVTVNFAAGSATVRYDETRLDVADIKSGVRQRGYESDAAEATASIDSNEIHPAPDATAAKPAPVSTPATPKAAAVEPAASVAPTQQPLSQKILDRHRPHRHRPLQHLIKTRPKTSRAWLTK